MAKQDPKIFKDSEPLKLEDDGTIRHLQIAYHTYGSLNADKSNVIWVCHALTADSEVADWWPHTVESGSFLDPEKYFVVCANILGSHYGTTGPLTPGPDGEAPLYGQFPRVTIRDIVAAHKRLAAHLGISRVKLLIGSSLGGFQCQEWALSEPDFAENVALIATAPFTTPWAAAFNESQRMAIEADATYGQPRDDAGAAGLEAARSIALLSYRGAPAYNITQADKPEYQPTPFIHRVHSYQRHQGEKLKNRFNAYSYVRMSEAVDSHNIGRGRGGIVMALSHFKPRALIVAITSDILFPPEDHQLFIKHIPSNEYHLIDSDFGHDGFLIEHAKLNEIIRNFLGDRPNSLS